MGIAYGVRGSERRGTQNIGGSTAHAVYRYEQLSGGRGAGSAI